MTALPDLMRRLDRKLDIQRGLHLSYDDLALLVASGAYATLQQAAEDEEREYNLPSVPPQRSDDDPFIYFIRAGENGPIKIGFARDVEKRRTGLQPSTHEQLIILATVRAPLYTEGLLQHHFEEEHIRGEWFRPSPRLLRFIETLR